VLLFLMAHKTGVGLSALAIVVVAYWLSRLLNRRLSEAH